MTTGTLRSTENGSHTWTRRITLEEAIKRFSKLGTVCQGKNSDNNYRLTVTRFCGGKIKAKFFPSR